MEVMESTAFINGKAVRDFAADLSSYLGVKNIPSLRERNRCPSIAMMALDCNRGDEIITPSFTYIATTEVISFVAPYPCICGSGPKDILY